jgi:hypothetical protein
MKRVLSTGFLSVLSVKGKTIGKQKKALEFQGL